MTTDWTNAPGPKRWQRTYSLTTPFAEHIADELIYEFYYELFERFGLTDAHYSTQTDFIASEGHRENRARERHETLRDQLTHESTLVVSIGTQLPPELPIRYEFDTAESAREGVAALAASILTHRGEWGELREAIEALAADIAGPIQIGLSLLDHPHE